MKTFQHNALTSRANAFHMRVFMLIKRLASLIPWSLVLTGKMNWSVFLNILSSFLGRDFTHNHGTESINTISWRDIYNNDQQTNWEGIQWMNNLINLYHDLINVYKNSFKIFSFIYTYCWNHWEISCYDHCRICKVKGIMGTTKLYPFHGPV